MKSPEIELCQFLKKPDDDPILNMIFEDVKKYGNFATSCPILKGKYFVKDFQLDENKLPSFTPAGHYRVDFIWDVEQNGARKQIYYGKYFATVVRK